MKAHAHNPRNLRHPRQRGVASLLAMIFLAIFASLATAMALVSQSNLRSADTYQHANRALAASETGVQFAKYELATLSATVTTNKGTIDATLAKTLWAQVALKLYGQIGVQAQFLDNPQITYDPQGNAKRVVLGRVRCGGDDQAATFQLTFEAHPLTGEDYGSAFYQHSPYNISGGVNDYTADGNAVASGNTIQPWVVRMIAVGEDRGVQRVVRLDFQMFKKVRYAILSRNRIMIGRNVVIEGPIGSAYTQTDMLNGHPIQMRDNFHGLNSTLDGYLNDLTTHLGSHDMDGDNRVKLSDTRESAGLADAAALDRNQDGYVDEYDMFLLSYDANADGKLTQAEFTVSGTMVDAQLWQLMNEAKYPAGTQFDWTNLKVKLLGAAAWTEASADLGVIDNGDQYAKLHGEAIFKSTQSAWETGAAGGDYQQYFRGAITPDAYENAATFGADTSQLAALDGASFDVAAYQSMATGSFAQQTANPVANDAGQPTVFTPAGAGTIESVPYQSPYPYDYYTRPVYENMVFTNVAIPKGTNALFVNCKFIGVTFVDTETSNTDTNYNYAGMLEADGSQKYANIAATVNGVQVTDTKTISNNVRFHNCTFDGTVATANPSAFTHVRNKLQFTGTTQFDVNAPELTAEQKALFAKSTIMAPQYSIDVGTFTDPTSSTEKIKLDGAIVSGVLDVRGQAEINGSIISTFEPVAGQGPLAEGGNPANFNTTIGYFESTAGDSEAEIPTGGYGKIIIRYDPERALPDGITGPIQLIAQTDTYTEGGM